MYFGRQDVVMILSKSDEAVVSSIVTSGCKIIYTCVAQYRITEVDH